LVYQRLDGEQEAKGRVRMPKNIVICCDGTGNEFGDQIPML